MRAALKDKSITLEITDEALDLLGKRGYDPQFGARPLRRIITNLVEDPLSEGLLAGRFLVGDRVVVDVQDDLLRLRIAARNRGDPARRSAGVATSGPHPLPPLPPRAAGEGVWFSLTCASARESG